MNARTIAVDIGSGYSKYLFVPESGEISDMQKAIKSFRTAVGPYRAATLQPGVKPLIVEFEDHSFYVGATAEVALSPEQRTNTLSSQWAFEDGHRALVYYILARALIGEGIEPSETPIPLRFITGLPQAYYEGGAEKLRNAYSGVHRFRHDGKQWLINLVDIQVVPQAMGAGYMAMETHLSESEAAERVGIIDIGTYTSDFCLSEDVQYHAYESGGVPIGVSSLLKVLKSILERDLGHNYTDESLRKAFERKNVLVRSQTVDITPQIEEAISQVGRSLQKSLPSSWDTNTMYLVLAGGGGAPYFFGDFFKAAYPHIKVVATPENAIVMGYAIYGAARALE